MMLLSCKTTSVAVFQTGSSFKSAFLINNPPDSANVIKDLTTLNGFILKKLSISPNAIYGVLSFLKLSDGFPYPTRLEIYNTVTGKLFKNITSNDLKNMISQYTSDNYPKSVKTFITFDIRWKDEKTVIFEVQPDNTGTGIESLAQNVSIEYDILKNEVKRVEYYERGNPSPITVPSHSQKTTYNFSINNGKLFIEGKEVNNMPGDIKVVDLSLLKK